MCAESNKDVKHVQPSYTAPFDFCHEQGKKLFFHFTFPSDKYCEDFGCPNIKSTRPKKIKSCQIRFWGCDWYYILCKLSTPDLTKQKKRILLKINFTCPVGRVALWVSVVQGKESERVKVFRPDWKQFFRKLVERGI